MYILDVHYSIIYDKMFTEAWTMLSVAHISQVLLLINDHAVNGTAKI